MLHAEEYATQDVPAKHARTHSLPAIEQGGLPDDTLISQNCWLMWLHCSRKHWPDLPCTVGCVLQYVPSGRSSFPGQYGSVPVQYAAP